MLQMHSAVIFYKCSLFRIRLNTGFGPQVKILAKLSNTLDSFCVLFFITLSPKDGRVESVEQLITRTVTCRRHFLFIWLLKMIFLFDPCKKSCLWHCFSIATALDHFVGGKWLPAKTFSMVELSLLAQTRNIFISYWSEKILVHWKNL